VVAVATFKARKRERERKRDEREKRQRERERGGRVKPNLSVSSNSIAFVVSANAR
jgi:hypothetical protein